MYEFSLFSFVLGLAAGGLFASWVIKSGSGNASTTVSGLPTERPAERHQQLGVYPR